MKGLSKKICAVMLAGAMFLAAGCGGGGDKKAAPATGKAEEKVLTVYSARSESLNNAVIKNFEKDLA